MQERDARPDHELGLGKVEGQATQLLDSKAVGKSVVRRGEAYLLPRLPAGDLECRFLGRVCFPPGKSRVAREGTQVGAAHGEDDTELTHAVGKEEEEDRSATGHGESIP